MVFVYILRTGKECCELLLCVYLLLMQKEWVLNSSYLSSNIFVPQTKSQFSKDFCLPESADWMTRQFFYMSAEHLWWCSNFLSESADRWGGGGGDDEGFFLLAPLLCPLWSNESTEASPEPRTFQILEWIRIQRRDDMNGRFQMQGGKNWILPK